MNTKFSSQFIGHQEAKEAHVLYSPCGLIKGNV